LQTTSSSLLNIRPKFPWNDPLVIDIPVETCLYALKQPGIDEPQNYAGIITAVETVPAGGLAFSGTSLDFVEALLVPVPCRVQEVSVTCTFIPRSTT
jgi:hypothetical protein